MIIVIIKGKIKNNKQDELREMASILKHKYALNEKGCEEYEFFIDGENFLTIERWSSQELVDIHFQAEHVISYIPRLKACVVNETFDVQFIKSDDVSFIKI
jgi:quinol monooxygenase YgiN